VGATVLRQLLHFLDFVEDDGGMQTLDQGTRIQAARIQAARTQAARIQAARTQAARIQAAQVSADAVLNAGVFEEDVLGVRESAAEEGSLARSPRTSHDYHGEAAQCGIGARKRSCGTLRIDEKSNVQL
jgi:hypothetical protein